MEKIQNTMILGLGTGRCGTMCLSDFLKQQPDMACCFHEHLKWKWYAKPDEIDRSHFYRYENFQNSIVGDVGSFLLPHVNKISQFFTKTKIIVIKRNKISTILSWMKWTAKEHNMWVPHTKGIWKDDGWDKMFPKFDLEEKPKEIAIAAYYDHYYEECKKLKAYFDVLDIETEKLNDENTRKSICQFCEFNLDKCKLDVVCRKNEGPK